jgi:magnesium transporter
MEQASTHSIVRDITYKSRNRIEIFTNLEPEVQPVILMRLSRHIQSILLSKLKKEIILPILEHLDPDDATDLLKTLPPKKQKELLKDLSEELQTKISLLLQFDPKTAAGLMSLNYIQVNHKQNIKQTAEQIHNHEKRTGKLPVSLVLEEGKLLGFLPIQELAFAKPSDNVKDYVRKMPTIKQSADYNSVINKLVDHPHKKVVVMGENDTILGVIYSDDVLREIRAREASTLYDFAGVSNEETIYGSVKQKVQYRYKWLIINLGTAFLASFTVGLFNETITKFVLLAVYMPIVAGMGGNAATQTLAVLVRGITLKQIDLKSCLPTLRREVAAAAINGLINGILVATVVIVFNRDIKVAFVLAIAMIVNLLVAGFFGTLVPLIMTKLGKDPATSATIFITTATDVLGFLVFLGLATVVLG